MSSLKPPNGYKQQLSSSSMFWKQFWPLCNYKPCVESGMTTEQMFDIVDVARRVHRHGFRALFSPFSASSFGPRDKKKLTVVPLFFDVSNPHVPVLSLTRPKQVLYWFFHDEITIKLVSLGMLTRSSSPVTEVRCPGASTKLPGVLLTFSSALFCLFFSCSHSKSAKFTSWLIFAQQRFPVSSFNIQSISIVEAISRKFAL